LKSFVAALTYGNTSPIRFLHGSYSLLHLPICPWLVNDQSLDEYHDTYFTFIIGINEVSRDEYQEMRNMYEYQYLVGGALSLFVSVYVLLRRPRTLALGFLFVFGLVISLWEVSTFFYRTAPNELIAAYYFRLVILTSHIGFPLYLLTILNIRERRNTKILLLILIPMVLQVALMFFESYWANYEFFHIKLGWVYRVSSYQLPLVVVGAVFICYLIGIVIALLVLIKKTGLPLLRKKYIILLVSFILFQLVGTTMVNALQATSILNPVFQMGGIMQFLAFLSIWYALSLKEKGILLSIAGKDFSQVYSSFLTVFFNSMISSQLGEEYFRFTDFIRKSEIDDQVSMNRNEIIFREREDLDLAELIARNLEIFKNDRVGQEVTDYYLRVLKVAEQRLLSRFDEFVKANEDFLKASDLIYGFSGGRLLERIKEDETLRELEDIDACLRIYKRILLSIVGDTPARIEDFQKILSKHYISGAMKISEYGEISIEGVRERVLKLPKDERASTVIDRLNLIISEVFEDLFTRSSVDTDPILEKLKHVLRLNKEKADALGIYPRLLGTLATKIPKTQIHRLYSDYLEELVDGRTRELEKAQESLLKSQRLAAIGEAAAMVGHDLRNPLQAIIYSLYLAKKELESSPNSNLGEIFETINEQVDYMNKIVSDLQYYAKPIEPNLVETNLQELLDETFSTIRVPRGIEVSEKIEDDFSRFLVDPLLMKRILTNLIINALQAMGEKGQLKITASRKYDQAFISVRDTGIGIAEENLDKLFQPLFTTKAKGQGLGLAVCKRLVEALEGNISVETGVGKGTTFTVKVPFKNSGLSQMEGASLPTSAPVPSLPSTSSI